MSNPFPGLQDWQVQRIYKATESVPFSDRSNVQNDIYRRILPLQQEIDAKKQRETAKNNIYYQMQSATDPQKKKQAEFLYKSAEVADLVKKRHNLSVKAPDKEVLDTFFQEDPSYVNLFKNYVNSGDQELLYKAWFKQRPPQDTQMGQDLVSGMRDYNGFWSTLVHWAANVIGGIASGVENTIEWAGGLIEKWAAAVAPTIANSTLWQLIKKAAEWTFSQEDLAAYNSLDPEQRRTFHTSASQDVLKLGEGMLQDAMTIWAPLLNTAIGVAAELPVSKQVLEGLSNGTTWVGSIVNKLPWLSSFRDSLPEADKSRFDAFVGNVGVWLLLGTKGKENIISNPKKFIAENINPAEVARNFQENVLWIPKKAGEIAQAWYSKFQDHASGLDEVTKKGIQSNPYTKEYRDRFTQIWSAEGGVVDLNKVRTGFTQELAGKIKTQIEQKRQFLNDEAWKVYNDIKWIPLNINNNDILQQFTSYLKDENIDITPNKKDGSITIDSSRNIKLSEADVNAIKKVYEFIRKQQLVTWWDALTARSDISALAKYDELKTSAGRKIIRWMRTILDKTMKENIPWLKELDKIYADKIDRLDRLEEWLVYKNKQRAGEYKDNFWSIVRNLLSDAKNSKRQQLLEIMPDIADRLEAIQYLPKLYKSYRSSPKMTEMLWGMSFGSAAGYVTWWPTWAILWAILGKIAGEPIMKYLRQSSIEKVVSTMSNAWKKRLEAINQKIAENQKLAAEDSTFLKKIQDKIKVAAQADKLKWLPLKEDSLVFGNSEAQIWAYDRTPSKQQVVELGRENIRQPRNSRQKWLPSPSDLAPEIPIDGLGSKRTKRWGIVELGQENVKQPSNPPWNTDFSKARTAESANDLQSDRNTSIMKSDLPHAKDMSEGLKQESLTGKPIGHIWYQENTSYRGSHQISATQSRPITDIDNSTIDEYVSEYKKNHGYTSLQVQAINKLKKMMSDPEQDVIVYRSSPKSELNDWDWVTVDRRYADEIKKQNGWSIYRYAVKAKQLLYPSTMMWFLDLPSANKRWSFRFIEYPIKKVNNLNTWEDITLVRWSGASNNWAGEAIRGKGLYLTDNVDVAKHYWSKIEEVKIKNSNILDGNAPLKSVKRIIRSLPEEMRSYLDDSYQYTYNSLIRTIEWNTGIEAEKIAEAVNAQLKGQYKWVSFEIWLVNDSLAEKWLWKEKAFIIRKY